ncbi:MAG TPA: MarR family transcriptional regulator [Acetobacteraceae bacterium]|nr:MarR family transcriptional regulator [Acetobacteraceae bacterium]
MPRPRAWTLEADLPAFLKGAVVGLVRSDERDLSARQLSVFLICCTLPGPHTVRGLAALLNIAKPAITRATDRLVAARLVKRRPDPTDRRSIHTVVTETGKAYLQQLGSLLADAAAQAEAGSEPQADTLRRRRS